MTRPIPGLCVSYKLELPTGVHTERDTYKMALYGDGAALNEFVSEYISDGEVSGSGYRAGGVSLRGFRVIQDGAAACLTWDDAVWDKATIVNAVAGLIYNASKNNRAVGVVVLEEPTTSRNDMFKVKFPLATASEGLFVLE